MKNSMTHQVCDERLKKEGGRARCCSCEPHEECTLNKPMTDKWIEEANHQINKIYWQGCVDGEDNCNLEGVVEGAEMLDFIFRIRQEAIEEYKIKLKNGLKKEILKLNEILEGNGIPTDDIINLLEEK